MTEAGKVAMGTGAGIIIEVVDLGQINITMVETVHAHTERFSASTILCTKD